MRKEDYNKILEESLNNNNDRLLNLKLFSELRMNDNIRNGICF